MKKYSIDRQLAALFDKIPEGIITLDKHWQISFINKHAEERLSRPAGYLVGKNIWREFPDEVGNRFYNAYQKALATQETQEVEDFSHVTDKWTKAEVYPSPDGLAIYFYDVTKQKVAEGIALRNESTYRSFLERITDGFIALDRNFCYIYVNKKIGEMVHRDPETLIGKNVWEEFPDAVGSNTYKAFRTAMKEQRFISNIDHYEPLNLWQENYIYPSPDGLSVFIKDISERKKLERELLEKDRQQQLKITAAALEAQEKERTYMGQELHDNVNQMIVATKLMLSQTRQDGSADAAIVLKCKDTLDKVIQENRRLAHELVKPDLQNQTLVQQLYSLVERMLKTCGIDTRIDFINFNEDLLDEARKIAIYRICQEQCTNIVKHAKAEAVDILLVTSKGSCTITITDDGQGAEEKKAKKGIGLCNIEGRAAVFSGTIEIKTKRGKGFSLSVIIPT